MAYVSSWLRGPLRPWNNTGVPGGMAPGGGLPAWHPLNQPLQLPGVPNQPNTGPHNTGITGGMAPGAGPLQLAQRSPQQPPFQMPTPPQMPNGGMNRYGRMFSGGGYGV